MKFTIAVDMITPSESIVDGETLVSTFQSFELGFFSPGNSKNRFLGIWYKNIPAPVLWVANRNNPITDASGVLTINGDGNLALLDGRNRTFWSSMVPRSSEAPVAQLLDSGNFVLKQNSSLESETYLWQSFDYPSDTLLPGMKLGKNLKTGLEWSLSSLRTATDPSSGNFTYRLEIHDLPYSVIRNRSLDMRFRTGPWNGNYFGGVPVVPNLVFEPILVQNQEEIYYMYESFNNPIITRLTLNPSGLVQRFVWNEGSSEWSVIFTAPPNECSNYGKCCVNGVCSISNGSIPTCECLKGFVPELQSCVKKGPSDCQNEEGFLKLDNVKSPDLIEFSLNESMNPKECEVNSLNNCSCRGYARVNLSRPGNNDCLMWYGDLIDISKMSGESKGWDIFVRVPSSELESANDSNEKKRKRIIMVLTTVPGAIILTMVLCFMKKQCGKGQECRKENAEVHLFDLDTISMATSNFSQENLVGAGGFSFVYKGILPTGQDIAVKRLSNSSGQGVEEFTNEVILIAKLQHRNLVGLYGSCIQGEERLLIYEYMPNKSLDHFIFDNNRSVIGMAKTIRHCYTDCERTLYLHQDSKLHIVHRDLKASNVLLDSDLNPKISDLGLARIFEGDEKVSETKRVIGTFGYMSPEYAVKGIFSVKSDVFSLGVLLLEIISGKKNRNFNHPDDHYNLLGHAWLLWNEGRALELVDQCLKDSIIESQVLRCVQVGLLCVQNFPENRPTMSSLNFMLAKEVAILPRPREPGFFTENIASRNSELPTENMVTITMLRGR